MHVKSAYRPRLAGAAARRRGLGRLTMLIIILAVLGSYISPVRSYIQRTWQISQERRITDEISRQHESLLKERDRLNSKEYIEQVARRDLGLVRPGEQSFVVKDLSQGKSADSSNSAPVEDQSFFDRISGWFSNIFH